MSSPLPLFIRQSGRYLGTGMRVLNATPLRRGRREGAG
uniref:Uncharacterized protein n=1 Tax=Anguilla anguilla TaxID=7936 RepID=A0A0E9SME3_ANGAN